MRTKNLGLLLLIPMIVFSCKGKRGDTQEDAQKDETGKVESTLKFNPADLPEEPILDIVTTEGTITVKLYKETPGHRDNFVKLASEGFYDGILFHRIIKDFMIQTGDPYTKQMHDPEAVAKIGSGGPGYTIPAEILPQFKHKKGALSAARLGNDANPEKNSSGSHFFIVEDEARCAVLDGEYSVFGETVSGIDIVDKIAAVRTTGPQGTPRDRPINEVKIISIRPAAN